MKGKAKPRRAAHVACAASPRGPERTSVAPPCPSAQAPTARPPHPHSHTAHRAQGHPGAPTATPTRRGRVKCERTRTGDEAGSWSDQRSAHGHGVHGSGTGFMHDLGSDELTEDTRAIRDRYLVVSTLNARLIIVDAGLDAPHIRLIAMCSRFCHRQSEQFADKRQLVSCFCHELFRCAQSRVDQGDVRSTATWPAKQLCMDCRVPAAALTLVKVRCARRLASLEGRLRGVVTTGRQVGCGVGRGECLLQLLNGVFVRF